MFPTLLTDAQLPEGHSPSDCNMVPISKGMTSKGKTPLSPTMREPKREQIQVSSRSALSRVPQDSLSLLSRRQAAAAPRLRRAGWDPPALSRSSRARTVRKRSLWPAIPQPGQGHPGMPGARKHKECACELGHIPHLGSPAFLPTSQLVMASLSCSLCRGNNPKGGCTEHPLPIYTSPKNHTFFPSELAPACVSMCPPEAKLSLMTG